MNTYKYYLFHPSRWITMHVVGSTDQHKSNEVILEQGQRSNVCCGADILLSGLYQNVEGESIGPICKTKIMIAIENRRVTKADPSSSLLHYVVENTSAFSICCEGTFIFDKEPCLVRWLESYKWARGAISSLQGFMEEASSWRMK